MDVATAPKTSKVRAYELIQDEPRTPAELMGLLHMSRNGVQKVLMSLRDERMIKCVGEGVNGAQLWGTIHTEHVGNIASEQVRELIRARGDDVEMAKDGEEPSMWDQLVVTGLGVDFRSGHNTARLQRADGTVWIVDLDNARMNP